MKNLLLRACAIAVASALALQGCGTYRDYDASTKRVEEATTEAQDKIRTLQTTEQVKAREVVRFHNGDWTSLVPLEIKQRDARDTLQCAGERVLNYAPRATVDILEFSQNITNLCGIPVRVLPDAMTAITTQGRALTQGATGFPGAAGAVPVNPGTPPVPVTPAIGQPIATQAAAMGIAAPANVGGGFNQFNTQVGGRFGQIDIKYRGTLPGLLDNVTSRLGLSWRYRDNIIAIYYLDTKVFRLHGLSYKTNLSSTIQSGTTSSVGAGGSSGSGSNSGVSGTNGSQQTTTITMGADRYEDLKKNIESMLTPSVGRASISASTGTITVTDTPDSLARIERAIDIENASLDIQVMFNVKVISVSMTDSNAFGIDWALVYKSLSGKYGFNLTNVTQKDPLAITAQTNVLSTANGDAQPWIGSQNILSALARQGSVKEIYSPTAITLNHHTVPIQIGTQKSYVQSAMTTQTSQVGSSTSLTPGMVTTGFNMRLTPYVLPDQQILLDTSINMSVLKNLRQIASGGTVIEAPEIDNQIFTQTARLRPGETLILSGFERSRDTNDRAGSGTPENILLGGSVSSNRVRDYIVILITPVTMK